MTSVSTQTNNQQVHILYISRPITWMCDIVAIFTDYNKACQEQDKLMETLKSKERAVEYSTTITTVNFDDFDKFNEKYANVMDEYMCISNFDDLIPSNDGLWCGFLAQKMKDYENYEGCSVDIFDNNDRASQTANTGCYIVVHFNATEMKESCIVGVFTNTKMAREVQERVLLSCGLSLRDTYDDQNLVDLIAYPDLNDIDIENIKYRHV